VTTGQSIAVKDCFPFKHHNFILAIKSSILAISGIYITIDKSMQWSYIIVRGIKEDTLNWFSKTFGD
jgi:hypothetical protein